MNKRVCSLYAVPAIILFLASQWQLQAQTSPAFTAVSADYFGCDPTVRSTASDSASCLPKTMYTKYVDPNIGTSMVTSQNPPTPTNTLITKTDGTQVQALHDISAYYVLKLKVNPNPPQSDINCVRAGTTLLGKEAILGIETYKYQQGEVEQGSAVSNGVDGSIVWLAPSLNCFSLRGEFHFKGSPTTFQLTSNVTLGTPPASVFDPPSGFVEMSPMEANHRISVLKMRSFNPAMTPEEAEAAWLKTSATNVGLQRTEAVWQKQHEATH